VGCNEDNISMDLRETECEGVDWTQLTKDKVHCLAFMNMVTNLRVSKMAGNCLTI